MNLKNKTRFEVRLRRFEEMRGSPIHHCANIVYHATVKTDYDNNWFRGAEFVTFASYSSIADDIQKALDIPDNLDAVIEAGSSGLLIAFYPRGSETDAKHEEIIENWRFENANNEED